MKTLHSVMAIGLVGCLLALPLAEARASQQTSTRPDPASVKQCLKQLGRDTKVMVRLSNGAKLEGWIGVVDERKFQLRWRRSDSPRNIDYNRVVALSRTGSGDLGPPPVACVELEAQWPADPVDLDISDWNNLRQVRIWDKVEVVQHNLSKHKGKLLVWTEESISLRLKNQDVTISREEVYRVTWLSKSKRGRNALIGLLIGTVVGLGFGNLINRAYSNEGFVEKGQQLMVASTAIGAGVGAGIRAAFPSHPTIYRAPRRKPEDRK